MTSVATSLKIPSELKSRLEELAGKSGKSTHAFVLSALEDSSVSRSELADQFLDDAITADEAMQRSGLGHAAAEVHAYVTAKVQGMLVRRPRAKRWRE